MVPSKELVDLDADTCHPVEAAPGANGSQSHPLLRTDDPLSTEEFVLHLDDYEILEEIARGGMGVVYRAKQKSLSRIVAVKMILAGKLAGDDDVRRFQAEAEAAANLRHPAIVSIYEIGATHGNHYFTMELVEGESLAARLGRGPMPPVEAATLMKTVAEAIHHAHTRNVIHRDLKPANILLDTSGLPHVTDFGLAQRGGLKGETLRAGQIIGTPNYMPPEQAGGRPNSVTPSVDIYSLGAVLYAAITARPPFNAATPIDTLLQVLEQEPAWPRVLNPMVPRDLESITMKCLRKSPVERYATAQAVADDLDRFLRGEPVFARQGDTLYLASRWLRKNFVVAGVSGTVAILMIVLMIATAWAYRTEMLRRVEREKELVEVEEKASSLQAIVNKNATSVVQLKHRANRVQILRLLAESHSQRGRDDSLALLLAGESLNQANQHTNELVERTRRTLVELLEIVRRHRDLFEAEKSQEIPRASELDAMPNTDLIKFAKQVAGRPLLAEEIARFLEE